MLHINGLTKRYGKLLANDHLSFDVLPGRITILLGPNGAGKSTAIKAIAGLSRFEGEITIDGHDNKSLEAKRALGYIPETPSVYEFLTINEHMEFIARAYGLTGAGANVRMRCLPGLSLTISAPNLARNFPRACSRRSVFAARF